MCYRFVRDSSSSTKFLKVSLLDNSKGSSSLKWSHNRKTGLLFAKPESNQRLHLPSSMTLILSRSTKKKITNTFLFELRLFDCWIKLKKLLTIDNMFEIVRHLTSMNRKDYLKRHASAPAVTFVFLRRQISSVLNSDDSRRFFNLLSVSDKRETDACRLWVRHVSRLWRLAPRRRTITIQPWTILNVKGRTARSNV